MSDTRRKRTQGERDAEADAATFLSVIMDRSLPVMPEWRPLRLAVWDLSSWLASPRTRLENTNIRGAARAAFRAVPGLRGDAGEEGGAK